QNSVVVPKATSVVARMQAVAPPCRSAAGRALLVATKSRLAAVRRQRRTGRAAVKAISLPANNQRLSQCDQTNTLGREQLSPFRGCFGLRRQADLQLSKVSGMIANFPNRLRDLIHVGPLGKKHGLPKPHRFLAETIVFGATVVFQISAKPFFSIDGLVSF